MLFAISGSQGSGKTTVLNEIEKRGFPVVKRKTSRSILEEWGVTLSQVNNERELTVKFQEEILKRKFDDEAEAIADKSRIWFTERTYADLFTYSLIALGKDNEYSDWIDSYFVRCAARQKNYNANYFLPAGYFDVDVDGVRGANNHYARMVDIVMVDVTKRLNEEIRRDKIIFTRGVPLINIKSFDVDQRVTDILSNVSQYI